MRHELGQCARALAVAAMIGAPATSVAGTYDLTIEEITVDHSGTSKSAIAYNGETPGPTLRFTEGEEVTINVTNRLDRDSSIHWHGLILPYAMDGVPGFGFPGIAPGETFTYRFTVVQAGTYWYHSHSGLQEQEGAYGSIVIEPKERETYRYDRDYVVLLSDSHDHSAERILRNLKMSPDYYNRQQRTLLDFFKDATEQGVGAALSDRQDWGAMRMTPTDISDAQGYAYLVNGRNAEQNWTALFEKGERIRLRFVNASAMTFFDIRIPGLKMTVVQADGNDVLPAPVDEFRIAVAETYDVIVRPSEDKAYTIFAETMARDGYARATLAPKAGMEAKVPELRAPPRLTMADMGMAHEGMDHGQMEQGQMDHSQHAAGGGALDPFYAPGSGLAPKAADDGRFLSYKDLKAAKPRYALRPATREIEIRLTGAMERYSWSINGIKYEHAEPLRLRLGERVRFRFVNETMMTHPMHLHGMWTIIDTGAGERNPVKHVVSVAPGATIYTETEVDAPGEWAFHCHLIYHMATGMFRKVIVEGGPDRSALKVGG